MLDWYEKCKKETLFTSELSEFITVNDLDRSIQNLVVYDDCVTENIRKI